MRWKVELGDTQHGYTDTVEVEAPTRQKAESLVRQGRHMIVYSIKPIGPNLFDVTLLHSETGDRRIKRIQAPDARTAEEIVSGHGWVPEKTERVRTGRRIPFGRIGQVILGLLGAGFLAAAVERFLPGSGFNLNGALTNGEIITGYLALLAALLCLIAGTLITIAGRMQEPDA